MNTQRVTRLLKLVQTLLAGAGQDVDGLAEACGISRRTLLRDIESLRASGVPIEFDNRERRYRIDNSHFLPPTNLTLDEALWLLMAAEQSSNISPASENVAAQQAVAKIEASLPGPLRDQLRELSERVTIKPPSVNPLDRHEDAYRTLLHASAEGHEVRIKYESLTECEKISTILRPYQLLFHSRSWYAIGKSSLHKEVRTFNVGRVSSAKLLSRTFNVPQSFSLQKYLGNAWGIMSEEGPDQEVHLRFSQLVAKNVSEVLWHSTQELEFAEDGSLDFQARVSGLYEIVWWVLGYGDQVEVIAPAKLRTLVARRLRAAAKQYDEKCDGEPARARMARL